MMGTVPTRINQEQLSQTKSIIGESKESRRSDACRRRGNGFTPQAQSNPVVVV